MIDYENNIVVCLVDIILLVLKYYLIYYYEYVWNIAQSVEDEFYYHKHIHYQWHAWVSQTKVTQ